MTPSLFFLALFATLCHATAKPSVAPTQTPAAPTPYPYADLCPPLSQNGTNFVMLVSHGSVTLSTEATIDGDVGAGITVVFANGSMNGDIYSPSITLGSLSQNGNQFGYNSVATAAYTAMSQLFLNLITQPCSEPIAASGTQTFTTPGVYCYAANYKGVLNFTFDAQNQSNAVYILQFQGNIGSTSPVTNSQMTLRNGARACNIFIVVAGEFAPLGTTLGLYGQYLVAGNIDPPGSLVIPGGRLFALGAYNMAQNKTTDNGNINPGGTLLIDNCVCAQGATGAPTAFPTRAPTHVPTGTPTVTPTIAPTRVPTRSPTAAPTVTPTPSPTTSPTTAPTTSPTTTPTQTPTVTPTVAPTASPTVAPTPLPTDTPTVSPTVSPTAAPSVSPTTSPTVAPTTVPTVAPTESPTVSPTVSPTTAPTTSPTVAPTLTPTTAPTTTPTEAPTRSPTASPTPEPTEAPTTAPTETPSEAPTSAPTVIPTAFPTSSPTSTPTAFPTASPTASPTDQPTGEPTESPTTAPTSSPTGFPTTSPTGAPTGFPTSAPTATPTEFPTPMPTPENPPPETEYPTVAPTPQPTAFPTTTPTVSPTQFPTSSPTASPTTFPTTKPTVAPTHSPTTPPPTAFPTTSPTATPTAFPTATPTVTPTAFPTTPSPTEHPSAAPTLFCPEPPPPSEPLSCPEMAADLGNFALLTYAGNINPATTVFINGSVGALFSVALMNGTVMGDIYSDLIVLGEGLELRGNEFNYSDFASEAYLSASLLYDELVALDCTQYILCPTQTFVSGVICHNRSLRTSHFLNFTFDAHGDPSAVFVVQIIGNVQGTGSQMNLINGAQACNIFVVVTGSLQIQTGASLYGVWLVQGSIDAPGDLTVTGALIALGPGPVETENFERLSGVGNINPGGTLIVSTCQCRAPTRQPTVAPPPFASPLWWVPWLGIAIVSVGVSLLMFLLVCYRGRPPTEERRADRRSLLLTASRRRT